MNSNEIFRIIVVGGGAGGLELVTRLGDALGKRPGTEIMLVDRQYSHLWKPLLHEVAAGTLNSNDDELSYLAHAHWHGWRHSIDPPGPSPSRRPSTAAARNSFPDASSATTCW